MARKRKHLAKPQFQLLPFPPLVLKWLQRFILEGVERICLSSLLSRLFVGFCKQPVAHLGASSLSHQDNRFNSVSFGSGKANFVTYDVCKELIRNHAFDIYCRFTL